jgi:hypothetical protein
MSITKLKTLGIWARVNWESMAIEARRHVRAKVITGMLTSEACAAEPAGPVVSEAPDEHR